MFYSKVSTDLFRRVIAILILSVVLGLNFVTIPAIAVIEDTVEVKTVEEPQAIEPQREVILNDEPLQFREFEYRVSYDIEVCKGSLENISSCIKQLEQALASNEYTVEVNTAMAQEIVRLEKIKNKLESDIKKIKSWEDEYYYAARTWNYLMLQGYGEVIASAIIGNMMIETSGGTLALDPFNYSSTGAYYGLCQWSLFYRPEVADMRFEEQLLYLSSDIEYEFSVFGNCYRNGFTYEDFLAMDDTAEAALAFAKVYERCGSGSYGFRKEAAKKAYKYFSLD